MLMLDEFLTHCCLSFMVQPSRFITEDSEVAFIASYFHGPPLSWFSSLLARQHPMLKDLNMFITELTCMFGDPNCSQNAELAIQKLIQGKSDTVQAYASAFQHIALDLDPSYGDCPLIFHFLRGLHNNVADLMLSLPEPTSLQDAISKALHCEVRLTERHLARHAPTIFTPADASNTTPMDIGAIQHRNKLTSEEDKYRMENNLCLYCGKSGHVVKDCKLASKCRVAVVSENKDLVQYSSVLVSHSTYPNEHSNTHTLPPAHGQGPSNATPDTLLECPHARINLLHLHNQSALIDSGAADNVMNESFANHHKIPIIKFDGNTLYAVDGHPISLSQSTPAIPVHMGAHSFLVSFCIIQSPNHPIILGQPWLQAHNPIIDWSGGKIISFKNHLFQPPPAPSKPWKPSIAPVSSTSVSEIPKPYLPPELQDFGDVFDKAKAETLPDHHPYDCAIDLIEGAVLKYGPIYNLSDKETETLYSPVIPATAISPLSKPLLVPSPHSLYPLALGQISLWILSQTCPPARVMTQYL